MKIYTADRETGTFIDQCDTIAQALELIAKYEESDKLDDTYEDNFYDVVNENHESLDTSFASVLKDLRTHLGYTQKSLSDELLIPKRTIEDWERGLATPPLWTQLLILNKLKETNKRKESNYDLQILLQ